MLLVLQSASGFALLWREEARRTGADSAAAAAIGIDTALAAAEAARPASAGAIQRIDLPSDASFPYRFAFARAGDLPYLVDIRADDGRLVRAGPLWQFPLELLFRLHESWFAGEAGRVGLLLFGLAALASLAIGLVLWWPRRIFAVRARPAPALLYDLHRTVGAAGAAVALLSLTTGPILAARGWLQPSLRTAPTAAVGDPAAADLSGLLQKAEGLAGMRATSLRPGPVTLVVFADRRHGQTARLWLDSRGTVLRSMLPGAAPPDVAVFDQLLGLHDGRRLGGAGRVAICCAALSLLILSLTGLVRFLLRQRARR